MGGMALRPPALSQGDRVAVLSPAGPLPEERGDDLARGLERLRAWGLRPELSPHAKDRSGYLAGSDADRASDLQAALDDPAVRGIFCVRGGYGCTRILPRLDWSGFRKAPKALVGYSDVTALLAAAHAAGVVGFHGPMVATSRGLAMGPAAAEQQRALLFDAERAPALPASEGAVAHTLVAGEAEGELVGGNLSLVSAVVGTPAEVSARDRILFLEDVDERPYSVDRMLTQLRQAGCLDGVRAIALGDFGYGDETADAVRRHMTPVFLDRLGDLGVPVAFGFPFGHCPRSWTLPVGGAARLRADDARRPAQLELAAPAVR